MTGSLRLRVAAEPSHLAIARAFISSSLRTLEQPDAPINDLRLAVSELMTVLVLHHQGPIDVELSMDNRELVTTITGPASLPPIPSDIVELVKRLTDQGLDLRKDHWVIRTARQ